jgi:hypothetical protein
MSTSASTLSLLQRLKAKSSSQPQQTSAPTANPIIANAIQNYSNATRITNILTAKKKEASGLISEKDINTYFNNSSRDELERRIILVFRHGDAKIVDYISMQNLFFHIQEQNLFQRQHDSIKSWLINQVLIANASNAINDLIAEDINGYFNNSCGAALERRIILVFRYGGAKIIDYINMKNLFFHIQEQNLFQRQHDSIKSWLINQVLIANASNAINDLIAMGMLSEYFRYANYFPVLETPRENSHNQSSRQRMHSTPDTPFKISNPLSPGFFTPDLIHTNTPKEIHLPVSVKGSKIHLKIPKKHFSQWPPAPFAPITPSNKKRRLDVAPK